MTSKEIAQMVAEIGLPYAYYQFPNDTEQPTPFVCFYIESNDDVYADDENYTNIAELTIELYTDNKSYDLEAKVESVLRKHEMSWVKSEAYIPSEKMFEEIYIMEVIKNG